MPGMRFYKTDEPIPVERCEMKTDDLRVKIFSDGSDLASMREMVNAGIVKGLTTNPSLCRKAGVSDYLAFAKAAAKEFSNLPLSLEVIADDYDNIMRQARILSDLGPEVRVKIPILNCHGRYNVPAIQDLASLGVKLNVTACLTEHHIQQAINALSDRAPSYVSVFAGRIADSGRSPLPTMAYAVECARDSGKPIEIIWASVREIFNIMQADQVGVQVITVFFDWLRKLDRIGCDLHELAIETTQMFASDSANAGYTL